MEICKDSELKKKHTH